VLHDVAYGPEPQEITDAAGRWVQVALMPGQRVIISATPEGIVARLPDRREERSGDSIEAAEPTTTAG
jgi:hypothetical protein